MNDRPNLDLELMDRVFGMITNERDRQVSKWGKQEHSDLRWYAILGEEFGEIGKSLCEGVDPTEEIVHLLAVGVAWLEHKITDAGRPQEEGR